MDITVFSVDSLVKLVSEFVEIFGIVGAVTAPLVLIWIWINWRTFYPKAGASDERKARLANDLERRRQWIADRGFEQRYLRLLKGLLGGITRLTHDARSLARSRNTATWPVRWFGLNPFTEGSYLLCLRLALIYPILSAFVVWLLGGEGVLAGMTLLPTVESEWQRVLSAGLLGCSGFLFLGYFRSEGWRSLIYLLGAFAGAGAFEFIRDRLYSKRAIARYWLGFNLFYIGAVLLGLAWTLPRTNNPELLLIPVFLVLLP